MTRFLRRVLATAAAGAAAGSLLAAVPAAANTAEDCFYDYDNNHRIFNSQNAEAVYCTDGEWLGVHDGEADGWSARAAVQFWHSGTNAWQDSSHTCWDDSSRHNMGAWYFCNLSITDGTLVRIHLWSQRNGVIQNHKYTGSFTT